MKDRRLRGNNITAGEEIACLFKNESMCDRSTRPVSEVFGQTSRHSGQTLSVEAIILSPAK